MIIKTKHLGEVEVSEDQILNFPKGILGFDSYREFVILGIANNDKIKILQSLTESSIAFFIISPWSFYKDYVIDIDNEELAKIGIESSSNKDLAIFNIITLGKTFKESTANLLAPIAINMLNRQGKQYILNQSEYTTRHELFTEGNGG